ncbi:hypothetical protein IW150_006851, partial [Coemansia sp. RSA 2607]
SPVEAADASRSRSGTRTPSPRRTPGPFDGDEQNSISVDGVQDLDAIYGNGNADASM